MSNLPQRKSLDEEGMMPYLYRTRARHNNMMYSDLYADMKAKKSVAESARRFGVTDKTMKGWQVRVLTELEANRKQGIEAAKEF